MKPFCCAFWLYCFGQGYNRTQLREKLGIQEGSVCHECCYYLICCAKLIQSLGTCHYCHNVKSRIVDGTKKLHEK